MTSVIENAKLAPTGNPTKLPSLPSPALSTNFLAAVKEILEVMLGRRGNEWDKVVTFRDLSDLNLAPRAFSDGAGLAAGGVGIAGSSGAVITQLEKELRESPAYKALMTRIGSVEDLAMFPEEFRNALSNAIASLQREHGAAIREVDQKVHRGQMSMASRLTEITAVVEGSAAGVRRFDAAYADANRALATSITQVAARLNNVGGVTIEERFVAIADSVDGLEGQWTIKLQTDPANGQPVIAGIGLSVTSPIEGPGTSAMVFMAEKFGFFTNNGTVMPFGIDASGNVYVNGTLRINDNGTTLEDLTQGRLNYLGEFSSAPDPASCNENDIYKNTSNRNTYILHLPNGVKTWELWLSSGSNGSSGQRGSVDIAVSGYSAWPSTAAAATSAFTAAYGMPPVDRDRMTLYGGSFSQTRFYNSGTWLTLAAFINGNMLVRGTLSAEVINGGELTGVTVRLGPNDEFLISSSGQVRAFRADLQNATCGNLNDPASSALTVRNSVSLSSATALTVTIGNSTGLAISCTGAINQTAYPESDSRGIRTNNCIPVSGSTYNCGTLARPWAGVYSASAPVVTSDERTKMDITDSDLGLGFINMLRPVSYRLRVGRNDITHAPEVMGPWPEGTMPEPEVIVTPVEGTRHHYGLIAQEVRQAMTECDVEDAAFWALADPDNPESQQALRYEELIAPLIRAVQELSNKVDVQGQEIATLKAQLASG